MSPTIALARCARPTIRGRSTYTVIGFAGYGAGVVLAIALCSVWQLTLTERLIALIVPPIAFVLVVAVATALAGVERIVFFQTATAAAALVAAIGLLLGAHVARLLDVTILGIGTFLVFGRIGCFSVACCHGRVAKWGVRYSEQHVALGLWPRLSGRPLAPVQLVESAVSLVLVVLALVESAVPGRAALIYAEGYIAVRFALELLRGDPVRPIGYGVSEAQWFALVLGIGSALVATSWITVGIAIALAAGTVALIATRRSRELLAPLHIFAIDLACRDVIADPNGARRETRLGVAISRRLLENDEDWVLSSTHPAWSLASAERIARSLWREPEVIAGTLPGIVHVLVYNAVVQSQRTDAKK